MANCPICQANIEEDFGLVTCASCGAQVLLEFDGEPQVEVAPPDSAQPEPSPSENISDELSQVPSVLATPATADMSEIADYGNSALSQGREGMLRFNLFVGGIDTSDIRGEVREALDDVRFLWDVEQLIGAIKDGELYIPELTPVKSALLVQKLRTIPVEIRWEQYAIHQS